MVRVLLAGGSFGGLFAANILARHGRQVLEEAAGTLDGCRAGIVTHEPLLEGLRRAGAIVDEMPITTAATWCRTSRSTSPRARSSRRWAATAPARPPRFTR